jgi:hypothetical protein
MLVSLPPDGPGLKSLTRQLRNSEKLAKSV